MSIENPYAYRNSPGLMESAGCVPTQKASCCSGYRLLITLPIICILLTLGAHYHFFDHIYKHNPSTSASSNLRKKFSPDVSNHHLLPNIPKPDEVTKEPVALSIDAQSIIPTFSPTVKQILPPTAAPTNAPTVHPTTAPTAAPSIAPVAPAVIPILTTTTVSRSPTVEPTAEPTLAPTIDPRQRAIWLKADSGADIDVSGLTAEAAVEVARQDLQPIACWNAISSLDRKSEDFMQHILFHQNNPSAVSSSTPIPLLDRLYFLPGKFCKRSNSPEMLQPHSFTSFSLKNFVASDPAAAITALTLTYPVGYEWGPSSTALGDRQQLSFKTFFFVFFLNAMPLGAPSAIHHVCYFADHRLPMPINFCFFDRQLSLVTTQHEFVSSALSSESETENSYFIASYRLPSFNEADTNPTITSVEMMVSGQDAYATVPGKLPSKQAPGASEIRDSRPESGDQLEFICTDSEIYCRSKFLVSEMIMFEERLSDSSSASVMAYLADKYNLQTKSPSKRKPGLSFELLKIMENSFNKDLSPQTKAAVVPIATGPKLTCKAGDPFGDAPIDSFQALPASSEDDKKKWNFAVTKLKSDIASLNIGGPALMAKLTEKVDELRQLRMSMFCPYLDQ